MKHPSRTSVLIVYYRDATFLRALLPTLGRFDEIVVVDGPYRYAQAALPALAELLVRGDDDLRRELAGDRRVRYEHRTWRDEREKRTAGYSLCSGDLVFLIDADEFIEIDGPALERFVASDRSTAAMLCQNLYLDGRLGANSRLVHAARLPWKFFAFKKGRISAEEHLDYLWLVGVDQKPADEAKTFRQTIASCYHFTGMRDRAGTEAKVVFYTSLYHHTHGVPNQPAQKLDDLVRARVLSPAAALDIHLHISTSAFGLPGGDVKLFPRLRLSPSLEAHCVRFCAHAAPPTSGPGRVTVLPGVHRFVRIPNDATTLSLDVPGRRVHFTLEEHLWSDGEAPRSLSVETFVAATDGGRCEVRLAGQDLPRLLVRLLCLVVRDAGPDAARRALEPIDVDFELGRRSVGASKRLDPGSRM